MYNLDIILDKSDKPKLSGISKVQVIGVILDIILMIACIILGCIVDKRIILIMLVFAVGLIFNVLLMILAEYKFKKKKSIHGTLELDFFNGKEVGVFKSNYNENIVIDFENVINDGFVTKCTINNRLDSIKITSKNTAILCNSKLIKCAIALYIKDANLIDYLVRNRYITK